MFRGHDQQLYKEYMVTILKSRAICVRGYVRKHDKGKSLLSHLQIFDPNLNICYFDTAIIYFVYLAEIGKLYEQYLTMSK